MRIVICWTDLSGFAVSCFRALAANKDIELLSVMYGPRKIANLAFNQEIIQGLNVRLLTDEERNDKELIRSIVAAHKPQVVVVPGWSHLPYRRLVSLSEFANVRFVMCMDNPWKGTLRQHLGRFKIRGYINRMSAIFVAGERAWQFAKRLGAPESKIYRGVYGFDLPLFKDVYERRLAQGPWPRRFLFMGRYIPLKGFDYLLPAYRKYRSLVSDPWPFTFCGQGPLQNLITAEPGAEDWGFVQPADQAEVIAKHGVFVMPSWYEAWSVALAEAMAAGLPAICTEEVGASVDLIRTGYTGLTVPTRDADRLTEALKWMHDHYDRLPEMGRHAREFASAHSAELWALRVQRMLDLIMQ
jgi:glycosyltransferase involved in cell wall biosynthesis